LLVDLEGHGREDLFDGFDVSRTVGCFTSLFPLALDLRGVNDPGSALMAVKEQLRRVPNRGIGYGILRYAPDSERLRTAAGAQVSFNYLGRLDHDLTDGSLFDLATESTGSGESLAGVRHHLINVGASVLGGCLFIQWKYSAELHEAATLERLADQMLERVRELTAYCLQGEARFAAADFPLIDLAPTQLVEEQS
jgi:non-ribosomal peptide synthase protein (TIGR01720 family)